MYSAGSSARGNDPHRQKISESRDNMTYSNTVSGKFIARPNRFIAIVDIDGRTETVHVKNTGRCKELLIPGSRVILQQFPDSEKRKTKFDLIAVYKGNLLINMDSQSPNKAVGEFIPRLFPGVTLVRPERTFRDSRFDFYIEAQGIPGEISGDTGVMSGETPVSRKIFMEVKGCTLETDGVCRFPDAPTERGRKHLDELTECLKEGYEAYIFFLIQMDRAKYFTPNSTTDPEFAEALRKAVSAGVKPLAYTCRVTEDSMTVDKPVKIKL